MKSEKIAQLDQQELEAIHADMEEPYKSALVKLAKITSQSVAQVVEGALSKSDPEPQPGGLSQRFLRRQENNPHEVSVPRFRLVH